MKKIVFLLFSVLCLVTHYQPVKAQYCSIVKNVYCPLTNNEQILEDATVRFEIMGSTGDTAGPCSIVSAVDCPLRNNSEILLDSLLRVMIAGGGGGGGGTVTSIATTLPIKGGPITTTGTIGFDTTTATSTHNSYQFYNGKFAPLSLNLTQVLTNGNSAGNLNINHLNKLQDSSGYTVIDIPNEHLLQAGLGITVVNWSTGELDQLGTSIKMLDWQQGILYDDFTNKTFDWQNRIGYDATGTALFNFTTGHNFNLVGTAKITNLAPGTGSTDAVNISQLATFQNGGLDTTIIVPLTSAEILTLNSVPINIGLPASGSGYYYRVMAFDVNYTYNTTAFDGNPLLFISATSTIVISAAQKSSESIKHGSSMNTNMFSVSSLDAFFNTSTNIAENDTLSIYGDNPSTVGDGTANCYVTVKKVKL